MSPSGLLHGWHRRRFTIAINFTSSFFLECHAEYTHTITKILRSLLLSGTSELRRMSAVIEKIS